jgi:hypothetical protein
MSYGKYAVASLTLSTILLLTACGGGGGSSSGSGNVDDNSQPASAPSAASSADAPTSASTALPTSASAPAEASSPAMVGEALPSLLNPQPGSTALTGTNAEGIWTSSSSIADHSVALIDPVGNISSLNAVGSFVTSELYGVISSTPQAWTLTSGWSFTNLMFANPTTSGSGAYSPQNTFIGSYVADGKTTNISWTYDAANALSVTQQSVAGTWSQSTTSLTIADDGSFTGKLSGCNVSGTMLLAAPETNHNMYAVTMSAAAGTSCPMPAGMTYTGNAAILFLPVARSNGYLRTILYNVKNLDGLRIAYGQLSKQ